MHNKQYVIRWLLFRPSRSSTRMVCLPPKFEAVARRKTFKAKRTVHAHKVSKLVTSTGLAEPVWLLRPWPVSQRIRSPRKSDPGWIRYASGFNPTSADSIRVSTVPSLFLLSTSHTTVYSCGPDIDTRKCRTLWGRA